MRVFSSLCSSCRFAFKNSAILLRTSSASALECFCEPFDRGCIHVAFGFTISAGGFAALIRADTPPCFREPGFVTDDPIQLLKAALRVHPRQFPYMLLYLLDACF